MGMLERLRIRAAIALAACACLAGAAGAAETRIALVVGNSIYRHVPQLENPANDARLMAETLRGLGFTLIGDGPQLDLDKAGLDQAVQRFGAALTGAKVALFYYAGHGVQVRGANYLVPVGANPVREADVDFQMLDLNLVLRQMEGSGTRLNLVILDACRNNPFRGRGLRSTGSGLAQMQAPDGTLISFATQPGNVALDGTGRNSPYTAALAQTIRKPGLGLFDAFNAVGLAVKQATGGTQQPWVSSSPIEGSFFFAGRQIEVEPRKQAAAVPTVTPAAAPARPPLAAAPPPPPALAPEQKSAAASPPVRPAVPPSPEQPRPAVGTFTAPPAPRDREFKPKDIFRDCDTCPEMVVVPAGAFAMGSPASERRRAEFEGPQHRVTIARPFAVGRFSVTFAEWDACVADGGCNGHRPADQGWGRDRRPVINVSWNDAKAYVAWLSRKTGKTYRLPSEAEREYVARAGTTTPFWMGRQTSTTQANYDGSAPFGSGPKGIFRGQTVPVESFKPNPFGLFQVHGNVWEWTEDCWNASYEGAPVDGSAWLSGDCTARMVRGGSWNDDHANIRSAFRMSIAASSRGNNKGFRVARSLAE